MKPRHAAALALVVWYLTMYDAKTQLLIDNPINRRYCACGAARHGQYREYARAFAVQHDRRGPECIASLHQSIRNTMSDLALLCVPTCRIGR